MGKFGDELALVVRPEVIANRASGMSYPEPEPESELGVDFCIDHPPSSDEVSDWVLDRISEVSKFLGVSFEGHKDEALKLFSAIEASWTGGGMGGQAMQFAGQKDRGGRELRRLECSINYD